MPESSPEILEVLENYYLLAKARRFDHVSIVMIDAEDDTIACADYAGVIHLERAAYQAVSALRKRLECSIMSWTLPKADSSLDASYVVYSIAHDPLCFDFIVWLITAEMQRVREGAPAPLKVGFWFGADPEKTKADANRMAWLNNVFRPALSLIGAVEDDRAIYGTRREMFVTREIVMAWQCGQRALPKLRTSKRSKFPGYVTLTLREADHWPIRNSNVEAWVKFGRYLQDQGEQVVFIRDTAKANEPLDGFETWPEAALDLHCRMAAYQEAKTNWLISNGPIALCQFSAVPWVQVVPTNTGPDYEPNTGLFWRDCHGIKIGEQFPWCRPDQRIVWEKDTFENLAMAWEQYAPLLKEQHASAA